MKNDIISKTLNSNNAYKLAELESFKNLKKLINERKPKRWYTNIFSYYDLILICLLNVLFVSYLYYFFNYYYTDDAKYSISFNQKLNDLYLSTVKYWFEYNDFDDYSQEECAIPLPHIMKALTRPIDDCNMCINLTKIERLRHIDKDQFLLKYAYTAIPVLIEDATMNWTAMSIMNFAYLKSLYKNKSENTCQFFPYKTKFKNLEEVFNLDEEYFIQGSKNFKPWYIGWSNCNSEVASVLRKLYNRPYFLPNESEMSKIDWIFMGTPGYGADIHIDDVSYASWQAQITGTKKWLFKPPAECMFICESLTITVNPGDILVFDSNRWFHSTEIIGNDISITVGSEFD